MTSVFFLLIPIINHYLLPRFGANQEQDRLINGAFDMAAITLYNLRLGWLLWLRVACLPVLTPCPPVIIARWLVWVNTFGKPAF
jgi:hypothetical protein